MDDQSSESSPVFITPLFRFWSYLWFNILSLCFTLFALYFMIVDGTLRRALHNHIIIVLLVVGLIYELTNIPWILHYNRTGVPLIASHTFYIIWAFVDYTVYSLQIALFAWATIERHILIFHDSWVATKRRRLLIHYFPIVAIIVYYLVYYSIVHFVPFCENS